MASADDPGQNHPENMSIPQPLSAVSPGGRRTIIVVCILLAVAVFVVFSRTLGYGFVNFDDDGYFSSNYHVKAGLTWNGALWAFQTG